jgi:putative DNA primase/helicase
VLDSWRKSYESGQRMLHDIARARLQKPEAAEEIARLAELSPFEYDQQREEVAKRRKVRLSTLDAEVERVRESNRRKEAPFLADIEPWETAVDGAELLDELRATAQRFLVLPSDGESVLALWVLFTHCIEIAQTAPILGLIFPEKRCGKTTAIGLLSKLVPRSLRTSNISASALFRAVEAWGPTLMIDEGDSFAKYKDELRGILNSGHTRTTAFVVRTVGEDHEPKLFSTWGAKLIALIGELPDTLHDRAIVVEMRRKLPGEKCEKLIYADPYDFEVLGRKCARWAKDNAHRLRGARPQVPEALNDRAADNWSEFIAIADAAGGRWPVLSRDIAVEFAGAIESTESVRVELLRNLKAVFDSKPQVSRLASKDLAELLSAEPEWRWSTYERGKPISQRGLAKLLRPFGIRPGTHRVPDGGVLKGYRVDAFTDTLGRYLPRQIPGSDPLHRYNPRPARESGEDASVTGQDVLRTANSDNPLIEGTCNGVTDKPPLPTGKDAFEAF